MAGVGFGEPEEVSKALALRCASRFMRTVTLRIGSATIRRLARISRQDGYPLLLSIGFGDQNARRLRRKKNANDKEQHSVDTREKY
jgi:hypothetical protein